VLFRSKEAVAAYCQNMGLYIDLYKEVAKDGPVITNRYGEKIINPSFKAAMSAHSEALRIGQMLGITASARGKINLLKNLKQHEQKSNYKGSTHKSL